jgi:hypothetical protein
LVNWPDVISGATFCDLGPDLTEEVGRSTVEGFCQLDDSYEAALLVAKVRMLTQAQSNHAAKSRYCKNLLTWALTSRSRKTKGSQAIACEPLSLLVAGAGFEPATFGL